MAPDDGHTHEHGADIHNACCEPQAKRNQQNLGNHKQYNYGKIARKRGAIRILKLYPSNPEDSHVVCELIESGTDDTDKIKYEALSWCWGREEKENFIKIRQNNKIYIKHVQPNLFEALKALRYRTKDRYLWVDAVCIDQDNLEEKNHQVEMMFYIYGNASKVCIWLGTANKASCLALRFIEKEVLHLQDFDRLCEQENASAKWSALLELMQRPWFSRRWVVQEIALAQEATVYCGEHSIAWRDFAIAVELFVEVETATHRLSEVMRKDSKDKHVPGLFEYVSALGASLLVDATERLFRDFKQEHQISEESDKPYDEEFSDADDDDIIPKPAGHSSNTKAAKPTVVAKNQMRPLLSLEYLVSSLTIFDTSVPHDTIYALLAIAKDTTPQAAGRQSGNHRSTDYVRQGLEVFTQRKRYNVNYELPYVDVCKEFIQFAIARSIQVDPSRALDVICRPWATEQKILNSRKNQQAKEHLRKIADIRKEQISSQQRSHHRGVSLKVRRDSVLTQTHIEESEQLQDEIRDFDVKKREDMDLPSWVPQLSGAPFGMYQQAGIAGLKMSRKNADPLVGLPSTTHKIYAAAETKKVDSKTLKFRKRSDPNLNHYSMYVKGFQVDRIEKVVQASLNGQIPREWADLAGWEDAKGTPPEAFWRTLVADRGKDGKNPPVYYSKACAESFNKGGYHTGAVNTTDLINFERNSVVSQFCRRVQAVIWNRALVKTKKGRLGLVGKGVKEGDLVCILYGLSVPVILRKSPKKKESVYQKELQWEARLLVNMVYECWKEVKARRHQHELRKRAEMAVLIRQWLKKSKWFRNNILTLQQPLDRRSNRDLFAEALEAFDNFRVENRKKAWPPIAARLEKERLARRASKQGNSSYSQVGGNHSKAETSQSQKISADGTGSRTGQPTVVKEEEYGFVSEKLKDGSTTRKRLVDWWEFEYQLKAFRRWREIIKERKERRVKEWREIMNMYEQAMREDEYSRFMRQPNRGMTLEYPNRRGSLTADEKSYRADYQRPTAESAETNVANGSSNKVGSVESNITPEMLQKFLQTILIQKKLEKVQMSEQQGGSSSSVHHAAAEDGCSATQSESTFRADENQLEEHAATESGASRGHSVEAADTTDEEGNRQSEARSEITDAADKGKHAENGYAAGSRQRGKRAESIARVDRGHQKQYGEPRKASGQVFDEDMTMSNSAQLTRTPDTMTRSPTEYLAPQIRPSWITHSQREALQKAKREAEARHIREAFNRTERLRQFTKQYKSTTKSTARNTLIPYEETIPKQHEPTSEDLANQKKAMDDLTEALRERYGKDGLYSYTMLGECYIHGMMDGEAMLLQNEGDPTDSEDTGNIPSVVFEIR